MCYYSFFQVSCQNCFVGFHSALVVFEKGSEMGFFSENQKGLFPVYMNRVNVCYFFGARTRLRYHNFFLRFSLLFRSP